MNSNTQPAFVSPYAAPDEAPTSPVFAIPDFIDTPDVGAKVVSLFKQQATMPALTEDSYEYLLEGSGAQKLADSGVAPLVAAARGYSTITPEGAKDAATGLGLKLSDANGRQLKKAADTGDAMLMPWHKLSEVAEASSTGRDSERSTYQLRPMEPVINRHGKQAKYLMPAGTETILGIHPATPASWVSSAPRVIVAEGLLKADSAFSAHLAAHGVSEAELLAVHGGNIPAARAALTQAMENVPEADRVLIISIVGCGTWHGKNEWNTLSVRDREVWIAMDADIASNRAVWEQANKMVRFMQDKKASEISVVSLPPVNGDAKAGLDDFFAAGHTWNELVSSVGDLPEAPSVTLKMDKISVAEVNLDAAVTYETKMVERDGAQDVQLVPLAEAAVNITKVETTRTPFEGFGAIEQRISGEISWQVRGGGAPRIERRNFVGQDINLLIGGRATAPVAMNALTYGGAAGAVVRNGAGQQVLAAWSETVSRAEVHEAVETSGLWEDSQGRLGFLTSDGHLTSEGTNPKLRAELPGRMPDMQIPWVDVTKDAQKIIAAWEQVKAASKVIHGAHTGLWDAAVGATFAAAVGLQPMGTLAVFCTPGSGKTALLKLIGGFYGPAWHGLPAIKLEASPAAIRTMMGQCNNILLGLDDARTKGGDAAALKELKKIIDGVIRMGYEPDAAFVVKVRDALGNWKVTPPLKNATKTTIIAGEDLEAIGLDPSTIQRALSFQTTEAQPLLRKRGEIGPVTDALVASRAMSVLMGAYLVKELKRVDGAADARGELVAPYAKLMREETETIMALENGPDLRDTEFLAPLMAGMVGFNGVIADAYRAQGRNSEADALMKSLDGSRDALVGAWRRHRDRYADEALDQSTPIINAIQSAIASGRVRWGTSSGQTSLDLNAKNQPIIGREDCTVASVPNQILLLQDEVVVLLSNLKILSDAKTLRSALKNAIVEKSMPFVLQGKRTRGILISREVWDAASGAPDPVEEATAIIVAAAPKSSPAAVHQMPQAPTAYDDF